MGVLRNAAHNPVWLMSVLRNAAHNPVWLMSVLRNASHDAGWLRRHAAATRITGLSAVCAVCSLFVPHTRPSSLTGLIIDQDEWDGDSPQLHHITPPYLCESTTLGFDHAEEVFTGCYSASPLVCRMAEPFGSYQGLSRPICTSRPFALAIS